MKLYLVRHGQSEGNVKHLWYGISDLPLTALGRKQAAQVGEKLRDIPLAAAYTSPLSRAADTARIALAGRDVPLTVIPDLREQDMGRLESMSEADISAFDPTYLAQLEKDWVHVCPLEGEPFDTGLAPRVAAVLDALAEKGEDCAIFSHNGPLCFAMAHLLGLPIETASRFYLLHGCYSMIELDPTIWNERHALLRHFNR